jgi:membrane associated rhomboid family serine protease
MNPAAVGFQCPDDVQAGNAGVRQPKRTAGLRTAGGRFGPVTLTLIGINVLVALATAVSAISVGVNPLSSFSSPLQNDLATAPIAIDQGDWWRVVTSAFTHVSPVHLVFNMLALLVFGSELERQLGRARYLTVYLVSALGGAAAIQLFAPPYQGVVGASAAIYGLLGALGVLLLSRGEDLRGLLTLLGINLVVSLLPGISWQGHLGGLVAGALVSGLLVLGRRNRVIAVGGTALLVVVLLVLVFGGLR